MIREPTHRSRTADSFRAFGRVIVLESGQPVPDLMVSVFDHDRTREGALEHVITHVPEPSEANPFGEVLGTAITDEHGHFEIPFGNEDFQERDDSRPDLLIAVFAPLTSQGDGVAPRRPHERLLHFSTFPWMGAGREEGFVVRLRREQLVEHDISVGDEQPPPPPPLEPRPLREMLIEATAARDERTREIRAAAEEAIAPKVTATLDAQAKAKRVALAYTAVDPSRRDDPLMVTDTGTRIERIGRIDQAAQAAFRLGSENLANVNFSPVSILIRQELQRELLRDITLPERVDLKTLCGLMHAASGDYSLRRTRSLRDAAERLRQLRDQDEEEEHDEDDEGAEEEHHETEAEDEGAEPDATVSERIQALVEAQVADVVMSAPLGEELPRLPLQRLRAELEAAELASGPAETTAYHDFHTIQLAYPEVWVEALDRDLKFLLRWLFHHASTVISDTGVDPDRVDEVLGTEIEDLYELVDQISGLEEAIQETRRGTMHEFVGYLWPEAKTMWHLLEPDEATALTEIAMADFPGSRWKDADTGERLTSAEVLYEWVKNYPTTYEPSSGWFDLGLREAMGEVRRRQQLGRTQVLSLVDYEARRSGDSTDARDRSEAEPKYEGPMARLHRLLKEMSQMLVEPYGFEYYAEDSTNLGLISTYRQTWEPGPYQVGDMVRTVPLAPGESRRVQVKESQKVSRATKEVERAMWTRSGESTRTARASTEIVRRAEASTNFTMSANGSFNIGIGSIGGSSSFARNQSTFSQATKKNFREAVIKASHEYRNERSLEVSTSEEDLVETTTTGELTNPNNELTVTYLLYELERQYRVSEQIHALQPVILVAQKMPRPEEITAAWLLRHEWILRRVLLDDSFIGALDELHNAFAGEEVGIGVKRANWTAQLRIVETLEGEHSHWLNLKRKLNQDLIQAAYRERIAEAAEDAGGIFADIGAALIADPLGAAEDVAEAKRKMLEDHLKWAHDELQQSAEKLATAREQLDSATRAYSEALESRTQHRTQLDQLRIHVKDNILYYMQAIWSHEPTDQRYFRLHNVVVKFFPQAGTATCTVREATTDEQGHAIPGVPGGNLVIEDCDPPQRDPNASYEPKLREVADLDRPLGFKGNYMIFPLKTCSLITDYMMREYLDTYFGIRDPDELSEFTTKELMDYREHLEPEEQHAIDLILVDRLSSPQREGETVVVPTGQLYMEALVGSHTLLEPFKLAHRGYDAAKAREELRRAGLENLRYAARLVGDEPQLDDPEVERRVTVSGDGDVGVDVQG